VASAVISARSLVVTGFFVLLAANACAFWAAA
jgi:hypothetical protein